MKRKQIFALAFLLFCLPFLFSCNSKNSFSIDPISDVESNGNVIAPESDPVEQPTGSFGTDPVSDVESNGNVIAPESDPVEQATLNPAISYALEHTYAEIDEKYTFYDKKYSEGAFYVLFDEGRLVCTFDGYYGMDFDIPLEADARCSGVSCTFADFLPGLSKEVYTFEELKAMLEPLGLVFEYEGTATELDLPDYREYIYNLSCPGKYISMIDISVKDNFDLHNINLYIKNYLEAYGLYSD